MIHVSIMCIYCIYYVHIFNVPAYYADRLLVLNKHIPDADGALFSADWSRSWSRARTAVHVPPGRPNEREPVNQFDGADTQTVGKRQEKPRGRPRMYRYSLLAS